MLAGEPPKRRMLHTCAEIQWSVCDGCEFLEVIDLTDRKLFTRHQRRPYEFKCHANVKNPTLTLNEIRVMTKSKCPMGYDVKRRRFK